MPETPRPERTELADWPIPPSDDAVDEFFDDEDYTAPVKANDRAMIQMLSARARKPEG